MSTFSLLTWHGIARTLKKNSVPENSPTSLQNPSLVHSGDRSFLQTFTPKLSMKFKLTPSSSCLRSNRQQLLAIPHGVLLHACPDGSCAQGQRHSRPLSAGQQWHPWIDKEFFFPFLNVSVFLLQERYLVQHL